MRRLLFLVMLLAAGAIINIAVAWACALNTDWIGQNRGLFDDEAEANGWLWSTSFSRAPIEYTESRRPGRIKRLASWYSDPHKPNVGLRYPDYAQFSIESGLPFLSLRSREAMTKGFQRPWTNGLQVRWPEGIAWFRRSGTSTWLPIEPIPIGFAANTLLYATPFWFAFGGFRELRRFLRLRAGLCPACKYPIGASPVCTECGAELPQGKPAL